MPYPDSLGSKVRYVWDSLGALGDRYLLIGGTAVAYSLGNRTSFDIDLVSSSPLEHPRSLRKRLAGIEIGKHRWIRRNPDHYVKFFATETAPKLDFHGKERRPCLETPWRAANGLRIASLTDLLYLKTIALAARFETRDGEDVIAILEHGCNVGLAIAAFIGPPPSGLAREERKTLTEKLADPKRAGWPDSRDLVLFGKRIANTAVSRWKPAYPRIEGPETLARRTVF